MLKKILQPSDITAVIDTREQKPLDLSPLKSVRGTLAVGDYSVQGLTSQISIERKELSDLISCIGRERDRFERCLQRLLVVPSRAIVVEASWIDLQCGNWRGQITPEQAIGSVLGWIAMGIPVVMAGNRDQAAKFISRMLYISARRRWRELGSFFAGQADSLASNARISRKLKEQEPSPQASLCDKNSSDV